MQQPTSELRLFTRGGQIILHNIRMFVQIMNKVTLAVIVFFTVLFVFASVLSTTAYQRYVFGKYIESQVLSRINPDATTLWVQPSGETIRVFDRDIRRSLLIQGVIKETARRFIATLMMSLIIAVGALLVLSRWLTRRGEQHTHHRYLKGDRLALMSEVNQHIQRMSLCSDLYIGELMLPKGSECAHLLFHGTTGTGKSTAIKQLLDQIRKRGDRAIIYDKSCHYLEEFFDAKQDKLLNPLDDRGASWHLWDECRDAADFDSLAAAQIPMPLSTQDPFWVNAARTIFSAAAFEMRNDPQRSIIKLLRYLLTADLEKIQNYLKGTEAETLVSEKIEKTAISIKSVLATYLKSMKYIKDEADPFSIRQWIQDESAKHWLFITSLGDRHETLKPLISSWLDIAVNALLSLPPNATRRIWLILDELTSLQQLPYLTQSLSEARKFGGCMVIGIQNYAQLAKVYGGEGAREISALLNTRVMFRQPDPELAKWSALNLGETIVDEVREGISYGANTMRDGISMNHIETRKPLINFSEMMQLPDLQAYVRLPGDYAITSLKLKPVLRNKINAAFIGRALDDDNLKEVGDLIEQCEKPASHRIKTHDKTAAAKMKRSQRRKLPLVNEILPT